mmetsp:Transcript_31490/g.68097  ORF Transcript_31490/g.68097 Transcript_31490/m.68097 type:complete len:218 (+) Transcript_31490:1034-1687(+)
MQNNALALDSHEDLRFVVSLKLLQYALPPCRLLLQHLLGGSTSLARSMPPYRPGKLQPDTAEKLLKDFPCFPQDYQGSTAQLRFLEPRNCGRETPLYVRPVLLRTFQNNRLGQEGAAPKPSPRRSCYEERAVSHHRTTETFRGRAGRFRSLQVKVLNSFYIQFCRSKERIPNQTLVPGKLDNRQPFQEWKDYLLGTPRRPLKPAAPQAGAPARYLSP